MSSSEIETRPRILAATWRLLEEGRGQGVRMSDIAAAAGVSRQAVYLHFGSRVELMVATTQYIDQVRGLTDRLQDWRTATTGVAMLDTYVAFWGNYLPEIYGVAKALLAVYETDEAAAAAWNDRMNDVRGGCRTTIEALQRDGLLAPQWNIIEAVDLFWTLLSVQNWEQLTVTCGWSSAQYVSHMQTLLKQIFVREPTAR